MPEADGGTRLTGAPHAGIPAWLGRGLAVVLLIALSPLMAVVALAVRATSRGRALHRAVRVGKDGHPFTLLKFRSMRVDAPGSPITSAGDVRVTRVGGFIRRWKIDELPQLINVARGEMALVGPRPEDPRYVRLYTPEQRRLLAVPPGLTSPASVEFRHEEEILARAADPEAAYLDEVLPAKLALDLAWLEARSLTADLGVLAKTVRRIVGRST